MNDERSRISALNALIAGSPELAGAAIHPKIIDEFNEVVLVSGLKPRKRYRLLQILHSTRALDSALAAFLDYHGCRRNAKSLGAYLKRLTDLTTNRPGLTIPNSLPLQAKDRYQTNIVDNRNRYMHGSGEYPVDDAEITNLLAEMHDCLVTILAL
jgi:hypothetical protein